MAASINARKPRSFLFTIRYSLFFLLTRQGISVRAKKSTFTNVRDCRLWNESSRLPVGGLCASSALRVYMFHLAGLVDRPARDGIVVLVRECSDGRNSHRLAPHSDELGASRLHVAGVVPRAALQHGSIAV